MGVLTFSGKYYSMRTQTQLFAKVYFNAELA